MKSKNLKRATALITMVFFLVMVCPGSISQTSAMTVFDPTNLGQAIIEVVQLILGIVNDISKIANQATQIAHLYSMVNSWLAALQSMDIGVLASLASQYIDEFGATSELLDACNGLLSAMDELDSAIEELFNSMDLEDPINSEDFIAAVNDWNKHLFDTGTDGKSALGILKNLDFDKSQLNKMLSSLQNAEGQTSAIQASGSISGLLAKQIGRLSFLQGHLLDIQSSDLAVKAAQALQTAKQVDRLREDFNEWTQTTNILTGGDGMSPELK